MMIFEDTTIWGRSPTNLDYSKNDIDRQLELEKYTDYQFSTTDKILGGVASIPKAVNKDIEKISSFGDSIINGGKLLSFLLIGLVGYLLLKRFKIWSF